MVSLAGRGVTGSLPCEHGQGLGSILPLNLTEASGCLALSNSGVCVKEAQHSLLLVAEEGRESPRTPDISEVDSLGYGAQTCPCMKTLQREHVRIHFCSFQLLESLEAVLN